jgi:hypothetical protein
VLGLSHRLPWGRRVDRRVRSLQPVSRRGRVRGSRACARPFAGHNSPVKALGNDHATSSTFSTNSSGASRTMPFGNRLTVYPIGFVAAELACFGNLRFARGEGAAPATALGRLCFHVTRLPPPCPPRGRGKQRRKWRRHAATVPHTGQTMAPKRHPRRSCTLSHRAASPVPAGGCLYRLEEAQPAAYAFAPPSTTVPATACIPT